MRFASSFLLAYYQVAASETVYDDKTILSVRSGGSMLDVRTIPNLLAHAGVEANERIAFFLSTANINTLKNAQCQVVPTSIGSVTNADLCGYLYEARKHLANLEVNCAMNLAGEFAQLDDNLHVNDPNAGYENQLARMNMSVVWELIQQYPRREVTVAVIDQGVNYTDPDMAPLRSIFTTSDGRRIDGGWNFDYDNSTLTLAAHHGHRVSRVLAARGNNSFGMVGVAPDHVRLVSLQINGGMSQLIEALDMAMDIGVDVISMSLSYEISTHSSSVRRLLETALMNAQRRNIILVSAAGNYNEDSHDRYPCWYGGPNAMCVAALSNDANYTLADFSNFGQRVDIAAFGEHVYTGTYGVAAHVFSSGTSFATPMVSAASAILLSLGVEPRMIKRVLLSGVDRFESPGKPLRSGGGALNILSSVKAAIRRHNLRPINSQRNLRQSLEIIGN